MDWKLGLKCAVTCLTRASIKYFVELEESRSAEQKEVVVVEVGLTN